MRAQFELRNDISARYLALHCEPLAIVCHEMAERFGAAADCWPSARAVCYRRAAVSVEFVHPVIVGKRALPALDLSADPAGMLEVLARPDDIVMAFAA